MNFLRRVNFIAVLGTLLLVVAVASSSVAAGITENWFLMAHAGVIALAGIGFVLLSYRDQ